MKRKIMGADEGIAYAIAQIREARAAQTTDEGRAQCDLTLALMEPYYRWLHAHRHFHWDDRLSMVVQAACEMMCDCLMSAMGGDLGHFPENSRRIMQGVGQHFARNFVQYQHLQATDFTVAQIRNHDA